MSTQTPIGNARRLQQGLTYLPIVSTAFWQAVAFLVLSYPLGVLWLCTSVMLVALSICTVMIWVGVPLFALAMLVWMAAARLERWRLALCVGARIASPYRPLPGGSLLMRTWARARDVAVWRGLLYLLLLFPLGIADLVIVVFALAAPLALTLLPAYFWALPQHPPASFGNLGALRYQIDSFPKAVLAALFGMLWLLAGQYVVLGMARGHAALARALLGPSRRARAALEARVAALSASRSRLMGASLSERQRIERDLHDGAQQRLVALAMDLGMAREKLLADPTAAGPLVDRAHEEAKRALAEIRDLVRGVYPAVLADRGLDAAISALVGRCPVPVTVTVELKARLPEAVESTAYFLIAEALTNVAKHSQATAAWVEVRCQAGRLHIVVGDNGVGGADSADGTGLAGLADRVAALDGRLIISSPAHGPTRVIGELPCGS